MEKIRIIEKAKFDGRRLHLKTLDQSVGFGETRKTIQTERCLWDPNLAAHFMEQGEWLLGNRYCRLVVSAALFANKDRTMAAVLNRYDENHHENPGFLSVPTVSWGTNAMNIIDAALYKLASEVVILSSGEIATFEHGDYPIAHSAVTKFAQDHDKKRSSRRVKIGEFCHEDENVVFVYLDNRYQGPALLSIKPRTGSLEIMMLLKIEEPVYDDIFFLDGKVLPNGSYRHSQSGLFTKTELQRERLTTKAHFIKELLI